MKISERNEDFLWMIYMLKKFYDHGEKELIKWFDDVRLDKDLDDYYYDIIFTALDCAAEIVDSGERVYKRNGYDPEDEVNIFSFSSREMQKYFKTARKLHRLNGGGGNNPYIDSIAADMESLRQFNSYSFDYGILRKRQGAVMDVLWGYDFTLEIHMAIWVLDVMDLFKERLPYLQAEYRKARREKRSRPKGGQGRAA